MDEQIKKLLTALLEDGKITEVGVAVEEYMRKEERKKRVLEVFGKPVPYPKKIGDSYVNYYRISYRKAGVQKAITAKTEEELYEKCFALLDVKESTLRSTYEAFFAERSQDPSLSSQTVHYDEVTWNKHLDKHPIADMSINSVATADILKFFKEITGKGNITRKAFNRLKTLLNMIFDYAVVEGLCTSNVSRNCPTKSLNFQVPKSNKDEVYRKQDVAVLTAYLKTLKPSVYVLGIRLLFCFCMRIGELRALTWEDYDEESGTMSIWHEIIQESDGDKSRVDKDVPHTKNKLECGARVVPVSKEAAEILAKLRKINGDKKYILNGRGDAAFSIPTNKINEHLREYCNACGVTYHSSHKARFYGITALYEAGIPEHLIQYIAGHSTVQMTQHYNRPDYTQAIDKAAWEGIFGNLTMG